MVSSATTLMTTTTTPILTETSTTTSQPSSTSLSPGCGKSPTLNSGTYTATVNGVQRQYILALPQGYDRSRPYKLIFGYHWLGGTMQDVAGGSYYGIQPLAANGAIFVAAQGLNNGWANTGDDDIAFTDQMLETLQADLCIDETQIYSMGWSYGGSMSYALACARPDVFRGLPSCLGQISVGVALAHSRWRTMRSMEFLTRFSLSRWDVRFETLS